ncbi:unnamed protein product [Adineta steineri]|uniref:Uncharacterized protein n=1 Tax=Adineta steineri TaxID=433720 RepID=A0A814IM13_9BILA|nr:unnamed protein product [Adineta steineri]CAF4103032.1 unnamed protein product [Adineta steineri]
MNQWKREMDMQLGVENMKVLIGLVERITLLRCWLETRINQELVNLDPEEQAECVEFEQKCDKELDQMLKIMRESVIVYMTNV